jgi:hypothetical protein
MRIKIAQVPILLTLAIFTLVVTVFLLSLFAVGVLVALCVEIVKSYSRASTSGLNKYKISKPVEPNIPGRKPTKIFKLPLPEDLSGKGVVMLPINEKELSEVH